MAGLQTLMQQGQMPGEAGMFSALPAQQGRNPVAFTKSLKQIPPEELIKIYNDPNDMRPKWAVASAYADAMKAKALQQGMQGQQAMAQNVAAQQKPPVADELMTRMAASGGEMRAYADGGAIKFTNGGNIPANLIRNPDYDENGVPRSPAEKDSIIRQNAERVRAYRQEQENKGKSFFERLNPDEPLRQIYDYFQKPQTERKPIIDAVGEFLIDKLSPTPTAKTEPQDYQRRGDIPGEGIVVAQPGNKLSQALGDVDKQKNKAPLADPRAERPNAGLDALAGDMTPYEKRLEEAVAKVQAVTRKRGEVTPEMQAARERVERARALQMQQGQEDLRKIREEGVRQLQGRLDAARRPLLEDPEALLALAASINTERGKELGSLAGGGAKVLAERRGRAEKAEEGITALNEKIRQLNAQYREAAALEEQRKLAQLTGDTEAQRNAEIASEQLAVDMRKTQADIAVRMRDVRAKESAALASRDSVAASRAGNELNRLQIALNNRQKVYQDAKEEWAKRQNVKLAAMQASLPGAKPEDVNKWQQMQRDFDTAFKNTQEIINLDAAIAQMGRAAGVPMPSGRMDTSGWGEVKVTNTPTQ